MKINQRHNKSLKKRVEVEHRQKKVSLQSQRIRIQNLPNPQKWSRVVLQRSHHLKVVPQKNQYQEAIKLSLPGLQNQILEEISKKAATNLGEFKNHQTRTQGGQH